MWNCYDMWRSKPAAVAAVGLLVALQATAQQESPALGDARMAEPLAPPGHGVPTIALPEPTRQPLPAGDTPPIACAKGASSPQRKPASRTRRSRCEPAEPTPDR